MRRCVETPHGVIVAEDVMPSLCGDCAGTGRVLLETEHRNIRCVTCRGTGRVDGADEPEREVPR